MSIRISDLFVYPVKSCRGIPLDRARVGVRGFEHDREWMIVDAGKGTFLTQRELPKMALLETALGEGGLRLRVPCAEEFTFPFDDLTGAEIKATVWMSQCAALDCGDSVAAALTEFLEPKPGQTCRLVRMKPDAERAAPMGKGQISLVDAFAVHGISEASLSDLNARLETPLPMDRFRPNLVFAGSAAYDEDTWKGFHAGTVQFSGDFQCPRCAIVTINQHTAERGKEPLATLAEYKKVGFQVMFGRYFTHRNEGEIAAGDPVRVETA